MPKKTLALLITAAASILTACSGGGSTSTTVTVTETVASETTSSANRENSPGLNEAVTARGATIEITSLERIGSIEFCADGYKCGYRPNETVSARGGGEFLVLHSTVTNNSKSPMDLTCSLPIQTSVFNTSDQAYSTIDSLYRIPGNPECNEQLQPGFSDEMKWIYEIPVETELDYFAFREINDDFDGETAYINLADAAPSTPIPADAAPTEQDTPGVSPMAEVPPASEAPVENSAPAPAVPTTRGTQAPAPVIGMTEAPGAAQPSVMNKTIQSCGDSSVHQTGTTFFTDGTSGWTQQCADQMVTG